MLNTKLIRLLFLLLLPPMLLMSCSPRQPFRYDFETEDTLDTLSWQCKSLFTLTDRHATSGQRCLKMELYPSSYPGVELNKFNPDWSSYSTLNFDMYHQEETPLLFTIRIDDQNAPSFHNRYNHESTLKYGMNHISLPLNRLHTSGTNRRIVLATVQQVIIFLVQPRKKHTIFLDNIHLE
ncbi:hypothetical protein [Candidatus Scalindua japonica]|uniref:hypothetical protein n=1 Tax=Candidatus Scalindua japonica TaxID=1284222 RepID=UPI0010555AD1|nr:hypothetical protein [Candidatus Scalindua japonica]